MLFKLRTKYKLKHQKPIGIETEWIDKASLEGLINDLESNQKYTEIEIEDEMNQYWTIKEYNKLAQQTASLPKNPVIYFDGGFDFHTNTTSIGVVIYYEQKNEKFRLRANAELDRFTSNKEAEYIALFQACNYLAELGIKQTVCTIKGDAKGLLKQLQGEWPSYDEQLNRWLDRIEEKINQLQLKTHIEVIDRTENKEAHHLATQALKGIQIYSLTTSEKDE